jgi:GxxExxY protein
MNTDFKLDLHHPENTKLLLKDETQKIIGFAFDVLNEVGPGLNEKIYENSLVVLFKQNGIAFDQQRRFPVFFRTVQVGEFIPDLIAFSAVIVDAKVIERITDHERGQMLNYLRITKLRVGMILNFKHARLEWERIVL